MNQEPKLRIHEEIRKFRERDAGREERFNEEDFREYREKKSQYQVSSVRIFNPTPLARLLMKERAKIVRERMESLGFHLRYTLNVIEEAFLKVTLGDKWEERLYLPGLEFAENAQEYLEDRLPEARERIHILVSTMQRRNWERAKVFYLASLPYFLTTQKETIETYEGVMNNGRAFPIDFFRHDFGRKAGIVTRHMYEKVIGYKPEEVFQRAGLGTDAHNLSFNNYSYYAFHSRIQTALCEALWRIWHASAQYLCYQFISFRRSRRCHSPLAVAIPKQGADSN